MIKIVTHCYAIDVSWYAKALHYQLSSLAADKPDADVMVVVCRATGDLVTAKIVRWHVVNSDVIIQQKILEPQNLFRRAIGRNDAALESGISDIVWFTDCDHMFLDGCLNSLTDWWAANRMEHICPLMVYPGEIKIHAEHAMGDDLPNHLDEFARMDRTGFVTKKYNRAIGGVQIVDGQYCATHGYLDGTKWQQPHDGKHFAQCKCDRAFRKRFREEHKGDVVKLDLPGVYRLRHTVNGRDVGK